MRILAASLLTVVFTSSIGAQPVTMGRLSTGNERRFSFFGNASYIDFLNRASQAATLTHAVVRWEGGSDAACGATFTLKFLEEQFSLGTYFVEERGPFVAHDGANVVTLDPPVRVGFDDLIGITQASPAGCGGVSLHSLSDGVMLLTLDDVVTGAKVEGRVRSGMTPEIFASTDAKVVVGMIPVAGSGRGSFGSFFRTSLQLTNPDDSPLSGSLVFHAAGRIATQEDPSVPFHLEKQGQTVSFADVVAEMGESGLGTIDIVTSGLPPIVSARVYHDGGAAGTSGFVEEMIDGFNALQGSQRAILSAPSDPQNFRMNIGVRSLDQRVLLGVTAYSASGELILPRPGAAIQGVVYQGYSPNYFVQTTAEEFTGIDKLPADAKIFVSNFNSGTRVIVYGTTTDNRTNATAIQIAKQR
jgi:hypothetical protein